jgi:catechol 2,3-dioxygenase-like lactoylglutathione lyase family enzyme
MGVAALDHVAMPVERTEEILAFYKRLGFAIVDEDRWRSGERPLFSILCGEQKINVHPPALWQRPAFTLRGPAALPGCGDLCFVWDGTVDDLQAMLNAAGASVEVGPVPREGGRGHGRTVGTSLYTRDPDGNLLEFIVYG